MGWVGSYVYPQQQQQQSQFNKDLNSDKAHNCELYHCLSAYIMSIYFKDHSAVQVPKVKICIFSSLHPNPIDQYGFKQR